MKSKIFIGGGGDIQDSYNFDKIFFQSLPSVATILYIPTAMAITSAKREACCDWFSRLVSSHTVDAREIDFRMWNEIAEPIDINSYSAVYVGGGNTFHLLEVLKRTGMSNELKKYMENGGVYYGGSAGGIIVGKSLLTVEEENLNNSLYNEGFNILNDLSIFPHFSDADEQKTRIKNLCRSYDLKIAAIPENAGIIVENNVLRVFGEVFIFEHEKETVIYSHGDAIC